MSDCRDNQSQRHGRFVVWAGLSAPAALVPANGFFSAQFTDADADVRSPAGRAADALDWRRLRAEATEPLLAGRPARWYPCDVSVGARPDGTYGFSTRVEFREPNRVIRAYACRPSSRPHRLEGAGRCATGN